MYEHIKDSLYKIKTERPSCTSYLILDDQKNILIDPGLYQKYDILTETLQEIGIKPTDIDIILNTHEHTDHIGANKFFQKRSIIMTHKYAATKIIKGDDEIIHCRGNNSISTNYNVHVWLENNSIIEVDNWFLKTIHTPGHTSGSVCFYEPNKKILFTGDTIYSNGKTSDISDSGNYSEYLNSLLTLNTLKIDTILPGHGSTSKNVEKDLETAIDNTKNRYERYIKKY
ncbi:MBL fold metallo-hydrolase [Methanosphaera sp.]